MAKNLAQDIQIIHCGPEHETLWERFVAASPQATFYHRYPWRKIIEKEFGHATHYLMAMEGNHVTGVLPIVHLRSLLFGSILCSMPFLNFGGICAESPAARDELLAAAWQLTRERRADYLELRHLHRASPDLPCKTHKVSMTVALDPDPAVLWNGFKTKHRTTIRRAEKSGLVVRSGGMEFMDDFYRIISIGWRDLGTPIYRASFFRKILELLPGATEIFLVYHDGKPIATAFNGLFRDTVEGMWTYSLREYSHLQTNYLLYWKMIEKTCADGYRHFHLGRSTNDTGATFYKQKWNAVPHQLYWEYLLNKKKEIPALSVDNPRFKLARELWQRLPVPVTQLAGPLVAKYIP